MTDDGKEGDKRLHKIKSLLEDGSVHDDNKVVPISNFINGNGNVVGNGNTVYFKPPVVVNKVTVRTGVGVITASQKRKINDIFSKWARVRGLVRKDDAEYAALRHSFNTYMDVNKYDEIKTEDFDKAIKWLYRNTGIVMSMPSARKKVPDWRKKRYASIMARAKEFADGEERFRSFAQEKYGISSLRDLNDDQLDAVYHYVFGWRAKR